MLLLTKAMYAQAIAEGRKTLEVRQGKRYHNIKPGDILSINGRTRVLVHAVQDVPLHRLLSDPTLLRDACLGDFNHARRALADCGITDGHVRLLRICRVAR